jgi:NADP-dependent 3-hydroxy acid dehydrogenase YdfG
MENIRQKRILLTGGTAGIGRATALLLLETGYHVTVIGRDASKLDDLILETSRGNYAGTLLGILVDITDEPALNLVLQNYLKTNGCPDVLINNAGIGYASVLKKERISLEYLIATNLWSYMWLSGRIAQQMIDLGMEGDIVNIGSLSANTRDKDSSAYVATKSGIQGFTESFRKEVNPHNIRVTLIEPGAVGTDMQPTHPDEDHKLQQKMEMLKPKDIAQVVLFVLQQPRRTNISEIRVKPLRQFI